MCNLYILLAIQILNNKNTTTLQCDTNSRSELTISELYRLFVVQSNYCVTVMYRFRLLLIIYIYFITNIGATEIEFCAKSWNVTCDCEKIDDKGLHFYCPQKGNVKIDVFLTGEYIKLDCDETMTVDDYRAISTIDLLAINRLGNHLYGVDIFTHDRFVFKNCVILSNGFGDMIQKLKGTREPKQLILDESLPSEIIDHNHRKFRSEHFNGFSDIVMLAVKSTGTEMLTLSPNTFQYVPSVTALGLTLPTLHGINGELFRNQRKLEKLELNQTPVNFTKKFFAHITSISALEVVKSVQLNTLLPSNAFELLRDVVLLVMARNNLSTLPSGLFDSNRQLKTLVIIEPELTTQPDDLLMNQKYLNHFTLSATSIETIHVDYFVKTTKLTSIDLSGNKLTSLPDAVFRSLNELVTINLASNHLKQLPESLLHILKPIKSMILNNNSLTTFPIFGQSPKGFEVLDLSDNRIDRISSENLWFPGPEWISLKNNLLTTINFSDIPSTLHTLHALNHTVHTTVHLEGNPLNCDDGLMEFIKYLEKPDNLLEIHVADGECSTPSTLTGWPVSQINVDVMMHHRSNFSSEFCSNGCDCSFRRVDQIFVMKCTKDGLAKLQRFPNTERLGYKFISLDFTNQNVTNFPILIKLPGSANVIMVNASNNNIRHFLHEMLSENWKWLDLSENRIVSLGKEVIESGKNLEELWLSGNPLECHCDTQLVYLNSSKVVDYREITCANRAGKPLHKVDDLCIEDDYLVIIALCVFALVVAVLSTFYYKYRELIYVWLYATFGRSVGKYLSEKPFDAFISFAEPDSDYVFNNLAPALENGPQHYQLCIHTRDWIAAPIIEQIYESVHNSRYTIIVLSENFLHSKWGIAEFRAAQLQANNERRSNVIMVRYGNVNDDDITNGSKEMAAYLRANTYLKWDDPWFLDKLRYSLRRTRRERRIKIHDTSMIEMSSVQQIN